ncbi:ComEA family DNA-binding protein [Cryobacterium sp. W22_MBD10_FK3]|uniref:ComEA family DNA-binding protein n=1 Tax=Cryobacterium sp. W22_MBD10_FK3 TaxID=3240273 RepID=UPI003F90C2B9
MAFDPFNSLAPSTRPTNEYDRARPAGPGRARLRIGVGAAVVLLLAALGVTVTVTAIGQVGHSVRVPELQAESAPAASSDPSGGSSGGPGADAASPGVFVHVLGAVLNPGLFEVHEGARVVDVVAAAGGLLPTADESGLNLAREVSDGEQLYVPTAGEVVDGAPAGAQGSGAAPGSPSGPAGSGAVPKVNLNSATAADLDTLPRIGPAMAQRILDYREAEGQFGSVDDLRNVTGIGDKTFAALKDLITV